MATFSLNGFSFFRHSRRSAMLVYCSVLAVICYLDSVNCAIIASNSSEKASAQELGNSSQNQSTLSRRQLLPVDHILANNPYLQVPAAFGFPSIYQNVQQTPAGVPFYPTVKTSTGDGPGAQVPQTQKKRQKVKVSVPKEESENVFNLEGREKDVTDEVGSKRQNVKEKTKKEKRKKEKLQKEANGLEKVESKAAEDEGTVRAGCPACVSGTCDPFLDTKNNISGIPIIQIIVALAVGAFWAAIFAFILHNFIEYQKEGEGGYGYGAAPAPQYGAPVSEYGAPVAEYGAPQSEYGAPSNHRVSYGYGRSSKGVSFNDLSNWVWEAIDKYVSKYDD